MASQTKDIANEVLGPFTEIIELSWSMLANNIPTDLRWDRLLITLFLALTLYLVFQGRGSKGADGRERKAGLLEFLLPRDIYTHISARVDIWLWIIERCLRPFWVVALFATVGPATEQAIINTLETLFGATPALQINYGWMLLYSLVTLLCYDFIFYSIHYAMHKVPALWAIHKVHHSASDFSQVNRSSMLSHKFWRLV